jgi:CysZ protein
MNRVISAFFLPFNGLRLIFKPGLRRFAAIPVLISALIYAGIAAAAYLGFDELIARYVPREGLWAYLEWLIWPLVVLAYLFVAFYSFTIIANLLGAPFNGILAARIEQHLTGSAPPEGPEQLWREILPAILGELRKLGYFVLLAIPVLILLVIPGVNVVGSALWVLLGLWFLALEYCDYPLGNRSIGPKAQRQALRARRLSALAFGAGATVLMLIPGLQLVAMPALVAGATRFAVDQLPAMKQGKGSSD